LPTKIKGSSGNYTVSYYDNTGAINNITIGSTSIDTSSFDNVSSAIESLSSLKEEDEDEQDILDAEVEKLKAEYYKKYYQSLIDKL
jgi:endonuclease III-like uncharacterized protein